MESRSSDSLAKQLTCACLKGDSAQVEQLLDEDHEGACPSRLVSHDSNITSALHLVCDKLGDLNLLKVLTSRKCDVDVKDFRGCTPLHYACFNGHIDLVTYLVLTLKCNPNMRDNDGRRPLHMACSFIFSEQEHSSLKIVQVLTNQAGCDCNVVTEKGETPLMLLCRSSCSKSIIDYLVHTCHCDISLKDSDGNTALHLACMYAGLKQTEVKAFVEMRNLPIVKTITAVDEHCGMHSLNNQNDCPLEVAIAHDLVEIASFLIVKMNEISHKNNDDTVSPLHIACSKSNVKLVSLLKKLKCASDKMGNTPLHIVCQKGYLEILPNLLSMNSNNIFTKNSKGELPIQLAVQHNHLAIAHKIWEYPSIVLERLQLVKAMEGFPFQSFEFPYLLHCACGRLGQYYDLDALKVLKEYFIHNRQLIDYKDELNGKTPLHYACSCGYFEIMVYLIKEYKADVTVPTKNGYFLLHLISAYNVMYQPPSHLKSVPIALEMVKFLVMRAGCDPNVTSQKEGDTPLMFLANNRYRERHSIAHYYIVDCNCDLTIRNKMGNTALHIACLTGNDLIVQMIIDRDTSRALLTMKNNEGNTPLHLACRKGKLDIIILNFILSRHSKNCGQYELNNDGCTPLEVAIVNNHHELASVFSLQVKDPKQDVTVETLLHDAYKNNNMQIIRCLARSSYQNVKNIYGDTLLHIACEFNDLNLCEVMVKACCDVNIRNRNGNTPLHVACQAQHIQLCEALLKADCDVNVKNNSGDTPLHVACLMKNTDLCELLLEACCDINTKNRNGDTPLHLAFSNGNFEISQLLISDPQVKTDLKNFAGDTVLHIACKAQHCTPEMVNYVLAVAKSDPNAKNNVGMTPIQLTTNARKTHELIRYGSNPMDVYSTSNVKMSSKNPPQPLVKIFVVGNASVGKSTLIAALQKELSRIVKILTPVKKISGVHEKTAGIIPCEFESKKYGEVTLYDFAGQREYYSTHAALLQNSIESSPPVFLIVVNLCESYEEIKKTILYWLSFLENQCTAVNEDSRPHVIVIGSHADILESKGAKVQEKASVIDHIKGLPHFKSLEIISFISMDCQYSQSAGMKKLREQLQDSCKKLRIKDKIRFNTHCFLVYLLDKFRDSTAVTLNQIFTQVDRERNVVSESNPLFFLPDCPSSLFDLCFELNDRGHILFLKDRQTLMKSWVVLDKQSLLNEVLGTIFAPEGLKEYCTLASNTGVVPVSKIAEKFSKYDTTMIVGFLTHLEFCHEISDEKVVQLINEESQSTLQATTSPSKELETYLFFPALVKVEAPDGIWKHKPQFINHFGWMLRCSRLEQFFTSRFLEVLILRLAFSCALSSSLTDAVTDGPSLRRKCTIWKNGIFWGDRNGIETLVEVRSDNKEVVVLMRSFQENLSEFLQLRSSIIQKVLITVSDFCAKVTTSEYFFDPSETNSYPLNSKTLFNAQQVFNAIVLRSVKTACIVSDNGESLPLKTLLTFEPFAHLGYETLSKMFSMDSSQCKKQIPDHIITSLPDNFAKNSDVLLKIMCSGDRQADVPGGASNQSKNLVHSVKAWRDNCNGTYHCLRQTFDQYSICAGRNLLVRHLSILNATALI